MITITVPTEHVITNGTFKDGATDILVTETGIIRHSANNITTMSNAPTDINLTLDQIVGINSLGGSVVGLPMFIRMSAATYAATVPTYVPNATYLDENEVEQTRTWAEWKDSNHSHIESNDATEYIVPGNSFGDELDSSVIAQLKADVSANYQTIYNLKEIRTILSTDLNFTNQEGE